MALPEILNQYHPEIESELQSALQSVPGNALPLYQIMAYQLGWVDKQGIPEPYNYSERFYSSLCLQAAKLFSDESVIPVAAGIEFLFNSIKVHEDMQTGDPHLEYRPSVWWEWGPAQAINIGDGLHALARVAVFRLRHYGHSPEAILRAINLLDDIALQYYEGQYLELTFQERIDVMESQYLSMAAAKKGSLLAGALKLGSVISGASDKAVDALYQVGIKLGLAAQIREDIDSFFPPRENTPVSPRVLNKTKLFPVIRALEIATISQKRALGEIYFKRVIQPEDLQNIYTAIKDLDVFEYAESKVKAFYQDALDLLEQAGVENEQLPHWHQIADYIVRR